MKIVIGADHRGQQAITGTLPMLQSYGYDAEILLDACPNESTRVCDYPDMAYPVALAVAEGRAKIGLLFCGTGIGMSISANKVSGVRAALVHDEMSAELARRHNDANVLCLAADLLGFKVIERIVRVFIETEFDGGRHMRRKLKVAAIENGQDPRDIVDDKTAEAEKVEA